MTVVQLMCLDDAHQENGELEVIVNSQSQVTRSASLVLCSVSQVANKPLYMRRSQGWLGVSAAYFYDFYSMLP